MQIIRGCVQRLKKMGGEYYLADFKTVTETHSFVKSVELCRHFAKRKLHSSLEICICICSENVLDVKGKT